MALVHAVHTVVRSVINIIIPVYIKDSDYMMRAMRFDRAFKTKETSRCMCDDEGHIAQRLPAVATVEWIHVCLFCCVRLDRVYSYCGTYLWFLLSSSTCIIYDIQVVRCSQSPMEPSLPMNECRTRHVGMWSRRTDFRVCARQVSDDT